MKKQYNLIKGQWDSVKNSQDFPENPDLFADKSVKWKCAKGHSWSESITERLSNHDCPQCLTRKKVTEDYNLAYLYPKVAKEWHSIKNGTLTPDRIAPYSNKKVWWKCIKGHEWHAQINSRSMGANCPKCAHKKVGKDNNLAVLKPELAKEWNPDYNGELTPYDVVPGSGRKVAWICSKGHQWTAAIVNRSKGSKCPVYTNCKAGKDNNLAVLRPDLAKEWDPDYNGELTPFDVVPGSNKKVAWICEKGHQWKALINDRSRGNNCPKCKNRKVRNYDNLVMLRPDLAKE
jgi:Zn finger protein HypA/HybF involved in hydrogenase expression